MTEAPKELVERRGKKERRTAQRGGDTAGWQTLKERCYTSLNRASIIRATICDSGITITHLARSSMFVLVRRNDLETERTRRIQILHGRVQRVGVELERHHFF